MRLAQITNSIVTNIIVAADLLDGYADITNAPCGIGWISNGNGTYTNPVQKTPEELAEQERLRRKSVRALQLQALAHDFGDGRVMQTRPQDEQNIRNAIELMTDLSIASQDWIMLDNKKYPVTLLELKTALRQAQIAVKAIYDEYDPEVIL